MYVLGNPLKYSDPTGHYPACIGENADAGPQCYSESKYIRARQSHLNWIYHKFSRAGTAWDQLPKTIQFSLESYGDSKSGYNETITGGVTNIEDELPVIGTKDDIQKLQNTDNNVLKSVFGWQYTPLLGSTISVVLGDINAAIKLAPIPKKYKFPLEAASYLLYRGAGFLGAVSTGYQARYNLYGTTAEDAYIAAGLWGVGAAPKPVLSVTANHASFYYTVGQTFGMIESPYIPFLHHD